jgi:hypothetical protein
MGSIVPDRPFLGASVATITDRVVPATEVFGPDLPTTLDVPTVDAFLLKYLPDDDPGCARRWPRSS